MGFIITQKGATLWELQHQYTLEDAWYLHEALWVPIENENIATEAAEARAKAQSKTGGM